MRHIVRKILGPGRSERSTPIPIPPMKSIWWAAGLAGGLFWIAGVILWGSGSLDEAVLFYYNPMRVNYRPLVAFSEVLTSCGMGLITAAYIGYMLLAKRFKQLNAPPTLYLYVILSFGISGISGDLLKEALDRPRPMVTYAGEILALSKGGSPAMPSGHATKSFALALPFLFLVSNGAHVHKVMKFLLLAIALGVGYSRIVLGAHYVSDVLAGIGMAFLGLPFAMLAGKAILRRASQERLPQLVRGWALILIVLTLLLGAL